ncbi:MAG TPA: MBL fold metallo-hydrolase [Solirubrobacteraceae bacterium]|nr:MBL fold metallo-hydrolase [Solirubrobacteraceae bacterium]
MERQPGEARIEQVGAGFWCLRLPLPYPAPGYVNSYLLAMTDGYCLVDCGTSLAPGWAALEYALTQARVQPDEIRVLVCTHPHSDHAGLAATVVERTGCEVARGAGPEAVIDSLRDPAIPLEVRRRAGLREGIPPVELDEWVDVMLADDGRHVRLEPTRVLADGDEVDERLRSWRAIAIPGHSASQIALFNQDEGWLISADLAYEGVRPFIEYGYTADPYGDHLRSLARAQELGSQRLFPGHGPPADDPSARLTAAREAATDAHDRIRQAIGRAPRTGHEIALEVVNGDDDHERRQSTLSVVLCVLEHLEGRGQVTSHVDPSGVRRFSVPLP